MDGRARADIGQTTDGLCGIRPMTGLVAGGRLGHEAGLPRGWAPDRAQMIDGQADRARAIFGYDWRTRE
jgi:hypothetical protein